MIQKAKHLEASKRSQVWLSHVVNSKIADLFADYKDDHNLSSRSTSSQRGAKFVASFLAPMSYMTDFKVSFFCSFESSKDTNYQDFEELERGWRHNFYENTELPPTNDVLDYFPIIDSRTCYDNLIVEFRGGIGGFVTPMMFQKIIEFEDIFSWPVSFQNFIIDEIIKDDY